MKIEKDEKWLRWCAFGATLFSTCSKQQYMSVIVDKHGYVNSTGYNGNPKGFKHCNEGGCPRAINNVPSGTPYDYGEGLCAANHAEQNALLRADAYRMQGGTIYVSGAPCFGCAKLIVNSGLSKLVFLEEDFDRIGWEDTLNLLKKSGIQVKGISWTELE